MDVSLARLSHLRDNEGLDLNALRAFVAVVDAGGFREAAAALGMPRSTISRKVLELEAALGVQLLQRTTRSQALTDAGQGLHARASEALAGLSDGVREVRATQAEPRGTLRVTAPPGFAEASLGPVLAAFCQAYPEVKLVLELTDRWVDLVAERFEVALRAGALPDSSLHARRLGESAFHCYASPAYLAAHPRPLRPADVQREPVLLHGGEGRAASWAFRVRGRRVLVPVVGRVAVNSLPLLRTLAEAGLGLTRLPARYAGGAEGRGRLVRVLEEYALPPVPLHAVYSRASHPSPRLRAFLDFLAARLEFPAEPEPGP
jgi:DNA-binding transcriptional LysR family regulator